MTRKCLQTTIALILLIIVMPSLHAKTFKIATISPDGLSWMKKLREGISKIEELTEGRVKFKVYPGAVQGDDSTVLRKMRIGQLQGGVVAAGSLTRFYPDLQVYSLPLRFKNYDDVDAVRQKMDQRIIDGLKEGGLISFSLIETGFAYILSKQPVSSLGDLKEIKPWVPDGDPVSLDIVRTFGITPIPLQITDVLPALQTGLIDAVAVPPIVALALQWHNQVEYITRVPLVYIYSMMAIDKKSFERLSVGDQAIVKDVLNEVFATIDRGNRADNLKAYDALIQQGIKENVLEDLPEWEGLAEISIKKLVDSGKLSAESLNLLDTLLERSRSANGDQ